MGSHISGAAALPANLNAEKTDVAPARLPGTASTASVFSPAHTNDEPAPAANHSAAVSATLAAAPIDATSPAHASDPQTATGTRPRRSTRPPDGRPSSIPARPKPARTRPRAVEPRPKASSTRSATMNESPV